MKIVPKFPYSTKVCISYTSLQVTVYSSHPCKKIREIENERPFMKYTTFDSSHSHGPDNTQKHLDSTTTAGL